jgi:hypothetical protein
MRKQRAHDGAIRATLTGAAVLSAKRGGDQNHPRALLDYYDDAGFVRAFDVEVEMTVNSDSAIKDFRRPREGGDPVSFDEKSLGSRLRGNDGIQNFNVSSASTGAHSRQFMLWKPHQRLTLTCLR